MSYFATCSKIILSCYKARIRVCRYSLLDHVCEAKVNISQGEIGFEPMTIRTAIERSTTELSALHAESAAQI